MCVAKSKITERCTQGEKRQHARARAGAVGHLSPKRLRDHADQWRDRQNEPDLSSAQSGVLAQIERKVRIEDPEGTEIGEPKKRQRNRMPHSPMIPSVQCGISFCRMKISRKQVVFAAPDTRIERVTAATQHRVIQSVNIAASASSRQGDCDTFADFDSRAEVF